MLKLGNVNCTCYTPVATNTDTKYNNKKKSVNNIYLYVNNVF